MSQKFVCSRFGACVAVGLLIGTLILADQARAQDTTTRMINFMSAGTDGTFGFHLREVDGPILANSMDNVAFYPASTIKVLEHLHAMRDVEAMNSDLDTTMVTSCPPTAVCTQCNPECPAPVAMSGVNCTDNPNSMATCGVPTVQMSLRCAIQRMMYISDNRATNALQDFFGGGTASVGRAAMNMTASAVVGMSASTALQHKLACGNIANNPFNTSTASDLALLYEQVATNAAVLDPTLLETFRALMENETNDSLVNNITNTANQEAAVLGMMASDADVVAFNNGVRVYSKGGNIGNGIASIAGLAELPSVQDCSPTTRRYAFSVFIVNAMNNTFGSNLRPLAAELLRDVINEALGAVQCDRPPDLSVPAPILLECNEPSGVDGADPQVTAWLAQASSMDMCSDPSLIDDAPGFFPADCAPGHQTDVTFTTFDECGNTSFDVSTVTVVDSTGPQVSVPPPLVLECNAPGGVPGNDPAVLGWLAQAEAEDVCASADVDDNAPGLFPAGCGSGAETTVDFTGIDTCGNQTLESSTVTVTDTTAPEVSCSVDLDRIWPPNHKLVDVGLSINVSETCDAEPTVVVTVHSDEHPADAPGAGGPTHCPDAVIGPDNTVQVRAERSGPSDGRVYTITATATDTCGNQGFCQVQVGVPKSKKSPATNSGATYDATQCGS